MCHRNNRNNNAELIPDYFGDGFYIFEKSDLRLMRQTRSFDSVISIAADLHRLKNLPGKGSNSIKYELFGEIPIQISPD